MRPIVFVFSALYFSLLLPLPTHAQICSEALSLDDFTIYSEEVQWIELENNSTSIKLLDEQVITNNFGEELQLSGVLLPGETKLIHLPANFLENQTAQEPEYQLGNIYINELFANPSTDETSGEFIELYNTENFSIRLDGWIVEDKSKQFSLEGLEIAAQSYLVLYRTTTGIALNNSSETVQLIDPFGSVADRADYDSSTEDVSWNRDSEWYEAEVSPGMENQPRTVETIPEETEVAPEEPEEEIITVLDENLQSVRLSELLPNPIGSDDAEWIELYNSTEEQITLAGLTITDGSAEFVFTNQVVQPDGFYLLERVESGIALNNSGDSLSLLVDGIEIDQMQYSSSTEGLSWGIIDEEWSEQEPTPAENNVLTEIETEEISEEPADVTTVASKATTYASWLTAKHNELAQVSGIITVPNNLLKAKTVFVSTASGIIEVYSSKNLFPDLSSGQQVIFIGKKSVTSNGERLLFQDEDNIQVRESSSTPPTVLTAKDEAELLQTGMLVQITGRLIEQNKKDLILELNDDEWNISLEHLPQQELLPLSSQITLIGALKRTDSEPELIPFLNEHLIISQPPKPSPEPDIQVISADTQQPINEPILIGGGIAGVGSFLMREKILGLVKGLISQKR